MSQRSSSPYVNLVAGGTAGLFEALCCHPLDTIKVRMQIQKKNQLGYNTNFLKTGLNIYKNEGFLSLYKGLGAVILGIIPKMAIRFTSYEYFKSILSNNSNDPSINSIFLAGIGAGITESLLIVNPMEVVKIRLQSQAITTSNNGIINSNVLNSNNNASSIINKRLISTTTNISSTPAATTPAKTIAPNVLYKNTIHCIYSIIRFEGFSALYKGVSLTCLRQATNQGANFTVYTKLKNYLQNSKNRNLTSFETSIVGLISGAIGPFTNAPLDTIKTRLQKEKKIHNTTTNVSTTSYKRIFEIGSQLIKEEGFKALYKGITPRVMRVAPGQAVTFTVYEFVRKKLEKK